MKKIFSLFLSIALLCSLTSCGLYAKDDFDYYEPEEETEESAIEMPINIKNIVVTIYPEYEIIKNILGDRFDKYNITLLQDNGVDLHNYQPTAKDIKAISSADLFIYVGGESDEKWVKNALNQNTNPNAIIINMMQVLAANNSLKFEETVEGMQEEEHEHAEEEHDAEFLDDEYDSEHEEEFEEDEEYDEHVWLSISNYIYLTNIIKDVLKTLDPTYANLFEDNAKRFVANLTALDDDFRTSLQNTKRKVALFGDRFPFRYLFDEYGLSYYAAFKGCSAESEASFKTIKFLADKVDELSLPYVMTIENSDKKIASTIIQTSKNKNATIKQLHSLQSITKKEMDEGQNYLTIMKENLETLKEVLN